MFGDTKRNADEIGKLWERLVPLERENEKQQKIIEKYRVELNTLNEKIRQPSDSASEAQTAVRSITQHRSNVTRMKNDVSNILQEVSEKLIDIKKSYAEIETVTTHIEAIKAATTEDFDHISGIASSVKQTKEQIETDVNSLMQLIEENSDISEKVEKLNEQVEAIGESESKSENLLKTIVTNHAKIRDLKNEIIGYEETDDTGETQRIEGLKDELEVIYDQLKLDLKCSLEEIEKLSTKTHSDYEELLNSSNQKTADFLDSYKSKYDDTFVEINKLLPQALTAGLSAAYDAKVEEESKYLDKYKSTFTKAIWGLISISTIPFIIDVYLLVGLQKELLQVLADTPKLIISILPLYLPVLWIAYSASKKQNLSKRLIEEYTHKGVLSKTFEGLSNQINELDDGTSEELKVKLLFNLLQVNSENPGKLISDYNTTDHPLMDALDKSSRLGLAIDKLNNIPGFSKLVKSLEKKQKEVLSQEDKRVSEVVEKVTSKE